MEVRGMEVPLSWRSVGWRSVGWRSHYHGGPWDESLWGGVPIHSIVDLHSTSVCTDCVCAIQKPQWCTVVLVCHMEKVCMLLLVIGIVDRRAVNVPKQSAHFI